MTRKHFVAIAMTLVESQDDHNMTEAAYNAIRRNMGGTLARFNPAFSWDFWDKATVWQK